MNDNKGPQNNVIDLMTVNSGTALVLPDGLTDVVVLGFNPDGTLYFNTDAESLRSIAMLLMLAQRRLLKYHDEETGDDADPEPPFSPLAG